MRALTATCLALLALLAGGPSSSAATLVSAADWTAYKQKFLDTNGRIVDDANGHISHSEGQGYGLLLAYLAGDRADFDLIWSFTRTELLLRDDGLAAWKWDPSARPHITDVNNATDGDILIAYALARAGADWQDAQFVAAATDMVKAIAAATLSRRDGRFLLLPAAAGFSAQDRSDGPVVNMSYWIFEAFPVFARLDPTTDWAKVGSDGINLLARAEIGPKLLPPDWLSLGASPAPAKGFVPEFGYNAIRIPLYLLRAGSKDAGILRPFTQITEPGELAITNVVSGEVGQVLADPGYRIIAALTECVLDGTPVPGDLTVFAPTNYYPSTLHLLGLAYLAERGGRCG